MDVNEEAINPIVNFFHKLLGNHLWILPAALGVTGWIMWGINGSDIYLFIAILCSAIIVLYIITLIFAGIRKVVKSYNKKKVAKKTRELQEKQRQLDITNKEQHHASRIWRLVAHTDIEFVKGASVVLDFGIHDNNECLRFLQIPKNADRTWHSGLNGLSTIASHFQYNLGYGNQIKLIEIIQQKDVIYIQIEEYFYRLIKNFVDTGKWVKL